MFVLVLLLPSAAMAADKSAYSLFRRTPESLLRELSTDRPDLTESPYTVDAGWWQIELDVANYSRDHDRADGVDVKSTGLSLAVINLKIGLTSAIDLQTIIEPYTRGRADDRVNGVRAHGSGFGDITSRLKINLWGNDGGESALALLPYIKWPANQHGLGNDFIEGGLIVPYARELPGGWSMGAMTELDIVRNESDSGFTAEWFNTLTFGHDIAGDLGGYVELAALLRSGREIATFDFGLTYAIGRHVQLDCGANLGLTTAADDLTVFAGLSTRF